MVELDQIHKMILSIVIFLPANDPGSLTKSFSICMYIKMPFQVMPFVFVTLCVEAF